MDSRILYNNLLDEIQDDEKALALKKALAELIRVRLPPQDEAAGSNHSGGGLKRVVLKSELTLQQKVKTAAANIAAREFSAGDLHDYLHDEGYPLPNAAKSKITTMMARLASSGELVRTFEGSGSTPHRYALPGTHLETGTLLEGDQ